MFHIHKVNKSFPWCCYLKESTVKILFYLPLRQFSARLVSFSGTELGSESSPETSVYPRDVSSKWKAVEGGQVFISVAVEEGGLSALGSGVCVARSSGVAHVLLDPQAWPSDAGSLGGAPYYPTPRHVAGAARSPCVSPRAAWFPGVAAAAQSSRVALEDSSFYFFCLTPLLLIRSTFCYISELFSLRTVILFDFISNIFRSIVIINIWIYTHTIQIWNIFTYLQIWRFTDYYFFFF